MEQEGRFALEPASAGQDMAHSTLNYNRVLYVNLEIIPFHILHKATHGRHRNCNQQIGPRYYLCIKGGLWSRKIVLINKSDSMECTLCVIYTTPTCKKKKKSCTISAPKLKRLGHTSFSKISTSVFFFFSCTQSAGRETCHVLRSPE